jgi:hypothetical protein
VPPTGEDIPAGTVEVNLEFLCLFRVDQNLVRLHGAKTELFAGKFLAKNSR